MSHKIDPLIFMHMTIVMDVGMAHTHPSPTFLDKVTHKHATHEVYNLECRQGRCYFSTNVLIYSQLWVWRGAILLQLCESEDTLPHAKHMPKQTFLVHGFLQQNYVMKGEGTSLINLMFYF